MGLDMYLTGKKIVMDARLDLREDGFPLGSKTLDLGYCRKHPNLHGYIVQSFAGGNDECQDIHLGAPARIRAIIAAVKARELLHTTGFFFGASNSSQKQVDEDIAIFERALAWLETEEPGIFRSVRYRASW